MISRMEQVISDEVLKVVQLAISQNENWMAYNRSLYFIDKNDIHFFRDKDAAEEFAVNNSSDYDRFYVICVKSIKDILEKIPYGEELAKQLEALKTTQKKEKNVSDKPFPKISRR